MWLNGIKVYIYWDLYSVLGNCVCVCVCVCVCARACVRARVCVCVCLLLVVVILFFFAVYKCVGLILFKFNCKYVYWQSNG